MRLGSADQANGLLARAATCRARRLKLRAQINHRAGGERTDHITDNVGATGDQGVGANVRRRRVAHGAMHVFAAAAVVIVIARIRRRGGKGDEAVKVREQSALSEQCATVVEAQRLRARLHGAANQRRLNGGRFRAVGKSGRRGGSQEAFPTHAVGARNLTMRNRVN